MMNCNSGTTLSADTTMELSDEYGFQILSVKPCRRIWRIQTTGGYQYLKKTRLNQIDLWYIYEAVEYLHQKEFQNIARFHCNKKGEPFVVLSSGIYILTDWFFGNELDFEIFMDLKQAARLLAEFHQKSAGFVPGHPHPQRTGWLEWPVKLENRLIELQDFRRLADSEKEDAPFSRLFLRHFEPYYRQAVASYEALLKSPYAQVAQQALKEKSFCHHDYSGRNILRTYQNQLILVDFDYCLSDLRIHDIINLLVRNLRHHHWNFELSSFILNEYQQVNPLSLEELEVLYVLLCWPQDFWQVGLQYYYEKLPWPKERFLKKLEHRIEYRLERNRFLKEFAENYFLPVSPYSLSV